MMQLVPPIPQWSPPPRALGPRKKSPPWCDAPCAGVGARSISDCVRWWSVPLCTAKDRLWVRSAGPRRKP